MSRGLDGSRTGDIASARRKGSRRTAAARARREQRRRLRAIERKHTKRLLRPAARVAKRSARDLGWTVHVERMDGTTERKAVARWTEAVVRLVPSEISVRFSLADERRSASSNSIRVYVGRRLVHPCPLDLLQSGDGRAFAEWLRNSLAVAIERFQGVDK